MPLLALRDLQARQSAVPVDRERHPDLRLIPDIVAIRRKPQAADHPEFEAFRTTALKRGTHLLGPKADCNIGTPVGGLLLAAVFHRFLRKRGGVQRHKAHDPCCQTFHGIRGIEDSVS